MQQKHQKPNNQKNQSIPRLFRTSSTCRTFSLSLKANTQQSSSKGTKTELAPTYVRRRTKTKTKTEEILTATAFAVNFPASRPLRFKPPQNLLSDLPTRTLPFLPKIKQNQSKPDLITKRNHHRKPTSISESKKKKVTCHRFNRCELSSLRRTKQICRRYSRCCSQTLQNHCHFRVQD